MEPQRIPLRGSCHCGQTKYILYLTLPHTPSKILPAPRGTQHIYRCNCTTCHKTGHMHVRPSDPASDFLLLSPLSLDDLGDYRTGDGVLRFLFCKKCAVRCFIFAGDDGEILTDVDVPGLSEKIEKAWRPRPDGGHPKMGHYISVNAHTIDAEQPQFDMRTLTEENKVMYCDCYSPEEDESPMRYGKPQLNGCY